MFRVNQFNGIHFRAKFKLGMIVRVIISGLVFLPYQAFAQGDAQLPNCGESQIKAFESYVTKVRCVPGDDANSCKEIKKELFNIDNFFAENPAATTGTAAGAVLGAAGGDLLGRRASTNAKVALFLIDSQAETEGPRMTAAINHHRYIADRTVRLNTGDYEALLARHNEILGNVGEVRQSIRLENPERPYFSTTKGDIQYKKFSEGLGLVDKEGKPLLTKAQLRDVILACGGIQMKAKCIAQRAAWHGKLQKFNPLPGKGIAIGGKEFHPLEAFGAIDDKTSSVPGGRLPSLRVPRFTIFNTKGSPIPVEAMDVTRPFSEFEKLARGSGGEATAAKMKVDQEVSRSKAYAQTAKKYPNLSTDAVRRFADQADTTPRSAWPADVTAANREIHLEYLISELDNKPEVERLTPEGRAKVAKLVQEGIGSDYGKRIFAAGNSDLIKIAEDLNAKYSGSGFVLFNDLNLGTAKYDLSQLMGALEAEQKLKDDLEIAKKMVASVDSSSRLARALAGGLIGGAAGAAGGSAIDSLRITEDSQKRLLAMASTGALPYGTEKALLDDQIRIALPADEPLDPIMLDCAKPPKSEGKAKGGSTWTE